MSTCGYCGHVGAHATVLETVGGTQYCTGCAECQRLKAQGVQGTSGTTAADQGSAGSPKGSEDA